MPRQPATTKTLTMATAGTQAAPATDWHEVLATAIRDADELCRAVGIDPALAEPTRAFPLLVPRPFVARMRQGDPHDPLLRQVLPLSEECNEVPGFTNDPLGESAAQHGPGLLCKYHGRSLIVTTGACAVHCRFCFRRHFPFQEMGQDSPLWEAAFQQLAEQKSLSELVLSGGDPLMLDDDHLETLLARIETLPSLRRLRIHTRLPVVIPQRITGRLVERLRAGPLRAFVVIHANHAAEIADDVVAALARLKEGGITLLAQSVLLAGVNDSVEALVALCERLVDLGVLPYYLHQLDPVAGAAHFAVSDQRGAELIHELRRRLPGYAVPQLVRETSGGQFKQPLA